MAISPHFTWVLRRRFGRSMACGGPSGAWDGGPDQGGHARWRGPHEYEGKRAAEGRLAVTAGQPSQPGSSAPTKFSFSSIILRSSPYHYQYCYNTSYLYCNITRGRKLEQWRANSSNYHTSTQHSHIAQSLRTLVFLKINYLFSTSGVTFGTNPEGTEWRTYDFIIQASRFKLGENQYY